MARFLIVRLNEFTREVMDKYGDLGDMAEPLEIDAVSITPL